MATTSDAYAAVPRAQLTYDYLHTNSTTHEFLFGALAELVDNARDAASKRIDIYSAPAESYRGKYMLCVLDDGDGMDPDEVSNVIKFGRSDKRIIDKNMIGQYGNGLKSGTMRIAKDMILFTKKDNKVSCLLISRTFHEREKITEILIPMPSWDARTKNPLFRRQTNERQHQQEVKIITDYSPFKTVNSLFTQFDKIKSTGTLVILFNLQLMDNGEPELDIITDPYDILMADPSGETFDKYTMPERRSFRAYTAILYLDPKMKVYIQNKKVRTVRLTTSLYKPGKTLEIVKRTYSFTSKRFKCRLEREEKKAEQELKLAESKAHELEIQEREEREKAEGTLKEALVGQRQAGVRLAEALTEVNFKKMILNNTRKALKDPQTLDFIFGINLNKRRCCGVMVYNCKRLIKMYEKVGCQIDGGIQGCGVMGVVNVPYLVLEPTHNKQDFADGKEYKSLIKAMGEHLDDYWKNCPIAKGGVRFWETYGYNSSKWKDDPSNEEKYVRKRMMDLPLYVQCDKCLKWRELAFHSRYVQHEPDENWCCKNNPDADCNNCQRPEKKPASITKVVFNRNKQRTTVVETSRETRPSPVTDNRSPAVRDTTKRQAILPKRQPSPPQRQPTPPPKTYKAAERPIRPVPAPPKPVVTTSSSSTRQKTQLNNTRQAERLTPSSSQTQPRQIVKQEKSLQPKSQVLKKSGRPKADSTEDQNKQDPMKRPHPDNNNVDEPQKESVKRRKSDVGSPAASASPPQATMESEVNNDMDWVNEVVSSGSPKPTPSKSTDYDIRMLQGRSCQSKTDDGEWHAGTIVCLKQGNDGIRAKVKFRDHKHDKYDKWYDYPGTGIRLEEPSESSPSSPVSQTSPQPLPTSSSIELPSTTTTEPPALADNASGPTSPVASPDNTVSSVADREDTIQDLAGLSRKLLEFFRPPNYPLTKEHLSSLSVQELRNFNARDFCDNYEKDLGTLMNDITSKARTAEEKAEDLQGRYDGMSRQLTTKTNELRQETQRSSEVTEHLTRLRQKTCRLIGMLNDSGQSGENNIPEDMIENTLDNFITMLQNEALMNNN